jgi:hypothetical protein
MSTAQAHIHDVETQRSNRQAALYTVCGLVVSVVFSLISDGFYQDDDITHFLLAKAGWDDPQLLFHWWARPGYNVLTLLPAHWGGFLGCRLFSGVQTALVAFLSYRIARQLFGATRWTALVPVLVWLQPLVLRLSTTSLTETPAALFLTLAVSLFVHQRRLWACAAMSLVFVTRYETLALAPIWIVALMIQTEKDQPGRGLKALWDKRVWLGTLIVLWAPAAYLVAAIGLNLPSDVSPLHLFSRQYTPEYGTGPLYHMIARWPEAAGLSLLVLAFVGLWIHGRRAALPAALVVGLLTLQSLLFWQGGYASGGYPRFMIPVCGLVAVLACGGLRAIWEATASKALFLCGMIAGVWLLLIAYRFPQFVPWAWVVGPAAMFVGLGALAKWAPQWAHRLRVRWLLFGLVALGALAQVGIQTRVLSLSAEPHHSVVSQAVDVLKARPEGVPRVLSQHVLVTYLMGDLGRTCSGNEEALRQWTEAPSGTAFVWENKYSVKPHEPQTTAALQKALRAHGESVVHLTEGEAVVEIFVRRPD